jgi:hypothetical protein
MDTLLTEIMMFYENSGGRISNILKHENAAVVFQDITETTDLYRFFDAPTATLGER